MTLSPVAFALLRRLSDGELHSGESLAATLGMTRAGVSQLLRQAERGGLALERAREAPAISGAGLKSPTVLVHDAAKLGGLPTELAAAPLGPSSVPIGAAANVPPPQPLRDGIAQAVPYLPAIAPPVDRNRLLAD